MTKLELKTRIEELEKIVASLQFQLNNHVCDKATPVFIRPQVPGGNTWDPYRWTPFIVNVS